MKKSTFNLFYGILAAFSLSISDSSFAQKHAVRSSTAPANKKLSPKPTVADERSLLEIAQAKARTELAAVTRLIEIENNKELGYDACKRRSLILTQKYDQWFLDHYADFNSASQTLDLVIAQANDKIASLGTEKVAVLAVQGQKSTEVNISLTTLISYFKLFNNRLQTCSKDAKDTLMQDMENPEANRLGVAHSQIVAAMRAMSTNLNTSLKSRATQYEINFSPAACGYSLELKVSIEDNGVKHAYKFSLLDAQGTSSTRFKLDDSAKWSALSQKGILIDRMPLDGMKRYRAFATQAKNTCQNLIKIPSALAEVPFLTQAELEQKVTQIAAQKSIDPLPPSIEMTFVSVSPGTFKMGSPLDEKDRLDNETQHEVRLSKEFEIQTTHVTQLQWFKVMGTKPSASGTKASCPETYSEEGGGMCPENPVEKISWDDAQEFISRLNALDKNYAYRLPTEAEWEFAARGGNEDAADSTRVDFNNDAWFATNSNAHTHEVARKHENQLGLFDMHGQVWQWCQDWYAPYSAQNTYIDPVGATSGEGRVIRGGSWKSDPVDLRPARRGYGGSSSHYDHVGFRLVRTSK